MRRPILALSAAVATIALAALEIRAQQSPDDPTTSAPSPARGLGRKRVSKPVTVPLDPMAASRGARHLLRNGRDYLGYGEYERALDYFREAEKKQFELTAAERKDLQDGIARAKLGMRGMDDPEQGDATVASAPRGRRGQGPARRPGAVALAPATAEGGIPKLDPIQLTGGEAEPAPAAPEPRRTPVRTTTRPPAAKPADPVLPEPDPTPTSTPAPSRTAAPVTADLPPLPGEPVTSAAAAGPLRDLNVAPPAVGAAAPARVDVRPEAPSGPAPLADAPPSLDGCPPPPVEVPVSAPAGASVGGPKPPKQPTLMDPPPPPVRAAAESPKQPGVLAEPAGARPEPTATPPRASSPRVAEVLPAPAPEAELIVPRRAPAASRARAVEVEPADTEKIPALESEPTTRTATASNEPEPLPLRAAVPRVGGPAPADEPKVVTSQPPSAAPAPTASGSTEPRFPKVDLNDLPPLPPASDRPAGAATQMTHPARSAATGRSALLVADGAASSLPPNVQREVEEIAQRQEDEARRNPPPEVPGGPAPGDVDITGGRLELPRAPSPTEARPIRAIPIPEEFIALTPRNWTPSRKSWAAAATCHMPLYFQDAVLERYGQNVEQAIGPAGRFLSYPLDDPRQSNQRNQILQPLYSIGLFSLQVGLLPLNLFLDPPWETEYDLGYYRPGDRIPSDTYYLPLHGIGPPLQGRQY